LFSGLGFRVKARVRVRVNIMVRLWLFRGFLTEGLLSGGFCPRTAWLSTEQLDGDGDPNERLIKDAAKIIIIINN